MSRLGDAREVDAFATWGGPGAGWKPTVTSFFGYQSAGYATVSLGTTNVWQTMAGGTFTIGKGVPFWSAFPGGIVRASAAADPAQWIKLTATLSIYRSAGTFNASNKEVSLALSQDPFGDAGTTNPIPVSEQRFTLDDTVTEAGARPVTLTRVQQIGNPSPFRLLARAIAIPQTNVTLSSRFLQISIEPV